MHSSMIYCSRATRQKGSFFFSRKWVAFRTLIGNLDIALKGKLGTSERANERTKRIFFLLLSSCTPKPLLAMKRITHISILASLPGRVDISHQQFKVSETFR